jgi:hypothetical protein
MIDLMVISGAEMEEGVKTRLNNGQGLLCVKFGILDCRFLDLVQGLSWQAIPSR